MSSGQHAMTLGWMLGCSIIAPSLVLAQDWSEASSLYSQGVHAYYAGRASDAESYLSRALALETQDPRLYYFRALSLMRMGRMEEARGDMMVGANLEAQHPNRFPIGTALQRVQGSHRLVLEQYRRQGRTDAATNREQMRRRRYPQTFDQESQVLRQRIVIPLDEFMRPGGPRPLPASELVERSPNPPPAAAAARTLGSSSAAATPERDDPFGDDPLQRADAPAVSESPPAQSPPAANASDEQATTERGPTSDAEEDPFSDFQ